MNDVTLDERALMIAVRGGDKRAFRTIFDRHARAVFAYSLTRVRDRAVADDVVQSVFVLLWEKRGTLELASESVLPWLLGVARLQGLAHIRASVRTRNFRSEARGAGHTETPEHAAEAAEVALAVRSAIDALPPLDRQIVDLCLDEGATYAEAARRLGLTEPGVRGRPARVRRRLRAELTLLRGVRS